MSVAPIITIPTNCYASYLGHFPPRQEGTMKRSCFRQRFLFGSFNFFYFSYTPYNLNPLSPCYGDSLIRPLATLGLRRRHQVGQAE